MDETDFPDSFICPISLGLFSDPVILGFSGQTFERVAIERWLQDHNTNPLTNQRLISDGDRTLVPNFNLRQTIEHYVQSIVGKVLSSDELKVNEKLNEGSQKIVFRANYKGKVVAVLKVRGGHDLSERECKIFVKLGAHPHLLRFIGRASLDNDDKVIAGEPNAVVTEWAPLGDLSFYFTELANRGEMLTLHHMLLIAEQVSDGMIAVHVAGIIHRDLAARNIMVFRIDANNPNATIVKVGDYGLATFTGNQSSAASTAGNNSILPFRWMSPESIRTYRWSTYGDIWSFGVVLWEIFTQGEIPFCHLDNEAVAKGIIDGSLRLSRPPNCPEDVWQLVQKCWSTTPNQRPSFVELKASLQQLRSRYSNFNPAYSPSAAGVSGILSPLLIIIFFTRISILVNIWIT